MVFSSYEPSNAGSRLKRILFRHPRLDDAALRDDDDDDDDDDGVHDDDGDDADA